MYFIKDSGPFSGRPCFVLTINEAINQNGYLERSRLGKDSTIQISEAEKAQKVEFSSSSNCQNRCKSIQCRT